MDSWKNVSTNLKEIIMVCRMEYVFVILIEQEKVFTVIGRTPKSEFILCSFETSPQKSDGMCHKNRSGRDNLFFYYKKRKKCPLCSRSEKLVRHKIRIW